MLDNKVIYETTWREDRDEVGISELLAFKVNLKL